MNPYLALLFRWARSRSFIPVARFVVRPLDMLVRRTGRPFSSLGTGLPTVYLTTTGRKSGAPRTTPVAAIDVPTGVAVIASNWGREVRPGWHHNLSADPRCTLERGGRAASYRARPAEPEEREQIWERAIHLYPPWQAYAERVDRALDMFVLEPVEEF